MGYDHTENVIPKNYVLSRNSSLACSSRVFYFRAAGEGVPFQWEMQPGTPKDLPKEDSLPPLSPPPAVLSLGLPKPCIEVEEEKPNYKVISIRLSQKLLKYIKKIKGIKKAYYVSKRITANSSSNNDNNNHSKIGSDEGSSGFCSSDGDFMASPARNSFFSCSSASTSFSNDNSRQIGRIESAPRDSIQGIHGCGPWNFSSSALISVARR